MKYVTLLFLTFLILQSCTTNPDTGNLDTDAWKKDRDGCMGKRAEVLDDFMAVKENFKNVTENEVRALLGLPDAINLYDRGQKFLIYHIDPSEKCDQTTDQHRKIVIRISSIHTVKGITLEQ